jgi:hypothetical protein
MPTRMNNTDKKRVDHMENQAKHVSWREKSWSMRTGLPELLNLPPDPNGKPTPTFKTLRDAIDWSVRTQ